MALTGWPFNDQVITETQFSQWATMLHTSGVQGVDDFKVTAGSGLTVNSGPGLALARGYAVYDVDDEDLTLDAADPQPRIDRIVLQVDPSSDTVERVIVKGTPAASNPVAPDLEQTVAGIYQLPIARIRVGADAVNVVAADITDERVPLEAPSEFTIDAVTDATAIGKALVRAATVAAAREALRIFKGNGPAVPQTGDIRFRDA